MHAYYWVGQMHCGPPNQNFWWVMANPPPCSAPVRFVISAGAGQRCTVLCGALTNCRTLPNAAVDLLTKRELLNRTN